MRPAGRRRVARPGPAAAARRHLRRHRRDRRPHPRGRAPPRPRRHADLAGRQAGAATCADEPPYSRAGRARAWAWIAHLRAGGTTPWRSWTVDRRVRPGPVPARRPAARAAAPAQPGRPPARRRWWSGCSPPRRPVAAGPTSSWWGSTRRAGSDRRPSTRPSCRTTSCCASPPGCSPRTWSPRRVPNQRDRAEPRTFRTRYELAGDPWLAASYTGQLVADGRPPGGGGRSVHVLGADLATMLAHTWAAGAFGTGGPSWPDFLARLRARRRLPRRVDLPGVVERFRARPHTGRVGVVLDLGELPGLVGVRRLDPVPDVPAHAAELARQVGAALSLLVLPAEQAALLTSVLRPRLAGVAGALPVVPPRAPRLGRGRRLRPAAAAAARSLPCGGGSGPAPARWSGSPGPGEPAISADATPRSSGIR